MSDLEFVALSGSHRAEVAGAEFVGELCADELVSATLILRRRAALVPVPGTLTPGELAERHGAHPADIARVKDVLGDLEITEVHPASRRIMVRGPVPEMTGLFGTELSMVRGKDPVTGRSIVHRARSGELRIPAALEGVVLAVLGLDNRPQARAYFKRHDSAARGTSYRPDKLANVYRFPPETDGEGQTIAVLELGGGFRQSELDTYFRDMGIESPSVTSVGVDDGSNSPTGDPNSADGEVLLDIEVAGALAPKARQVVYFAPNTDQGFVDALSTAVHATPTPVAVSISWGQSEDQWTEQARAAFDAALADAVALGITVTVAAGDNGSGDAQNDGKPHADFPASSPHALACGGTTLKTDGAGEVTSETVWNNGTSGGATGGGVSAHFALPDYQRDAGVPARADGTTGRGVPDVAADADPATGYQILVDGQQVVLGGTSAVAPLWAALVARLTQALGGPLGPLHARLYSGVRPGQEQPGFLDVTSGHNGGYAAGPGWDACTGLGVPDGEDLLAVLKPASENSA
ncbi:MAG TPA: S53 family peptidase [Amycolatopsis sp.]|uniref:S53 family peptidase n=1 Tax=Amycolatopsis sp. TaxID=37632 RepID=UPI002B460BF6|nr:S53 family peptidase [Amycolatopsis sp.]HKS45225.1 S53 family peptidase [Amycolatopsis sp.]